MLFQIFQNNNGYHFKLERFSSSENHSLLSYVQPSYQSLRHAYRDAHRVLSRSPWCCLKTAFEAEDKPIYVERKGEDIVVDHYTQLQALFDDRAKHARDEEEKGNLYLVIKDIVAELLQLQEDMDDVDKDRINSVIGKFATTVHRYFAELLQQDVEKMGEDSLGVEDEGLLNDIADEDLKQFASCTLCHSSHSNNDSLAPELLHHYAEKVSQILDGHHHNVIFDIDEQTKQVHFSELGEHFKTPLMTIGMNDSLLVDTIIPKGELGCCIAPLSSVHFYQRYWKPIVEQLGHFYLSGPKVLLSTNKCVLPDIPKGKKQIDLKGWNRDKELELGVSLVFEENPQRTWMFHRTSELQREAQVADTEKQMLPRSEHSKDDWTNARVQCVDPTLPSINGLIGEVVQVIPDSNYVYVDVNFGHGVVRLTEEQIELVPEPTTDQELV